MILNNILLFVLVTLQGVILWVAFSNAKKLIAVLAKMMDIGLFLETHYDDGRLQRMLVKLHKIGKDPYDKNI